MSPTENGAGVNVANGSVGNGARPAKHPILVVDDEPEVLASLRSMFRRDYRVLAADGGQSALSTLKNEDVHVVITDQRMPGMTGTELLAAIRKEHPNVIRLMMTGYSDINSVVGAINEGNVYRYIGKPWDPDELSSVVRQAVEQYELQDERRRLLRELREANQLKTAFITVASHELNTPLTIVLGMLNLAIAKNADEGLRNYLERSLKAAERLHGRLTATFKVLEDGDFTRTLDLQPTSCRRLFEEIVLDMEPFSKLRDQRLEVKIDPPELSLQASRPHLRDVLENLLSNAIKFSPDGGTIELVARRDGDRAILEVRDRGIGICAEDKPHIFKPIFSTLDTMRHSTGDYGYCKRGMGLGLAIAKRFVELHGGTIGFESTPSGGTSFRISLPLAEIPPSELTA
ncbi:MAG TPA: hybrid sensor histidine kinase/response regulator [Planctomycetia bacterium]|nr:hybrid sensor histidine kinase/response regulator [Planctomycetia bacterium]